MKAAPFHAASHQPQDDQMLELLFIYQLARHPLRAITRRWWCRSLSHASRGRWRCAKCGA